MNQFGLVQTVDGLGQCVVVTVATATNRGLDARFGQSLAIVNANALRASVGVMYQRSIAAWAPRMKCLFKCMQNEICVIDELTRQPTIRRANTSITKAT
ncbi:hypothetical protein LMG27177_07283 [Paraburkholderia fynbosensis]|uniref:Uncharacterized protein n=1 Tax=Paraburkholderia fynbosensis TaxID=1200993 RepID=A0A6J5H0Y0_9BURK|nr:hypothetical protein LMG27177_07283 [Paraburkholderia fynbosensis]